LDCSFLAVDQRQRTRCERVEKSCQENRSNVTNIQAEKGAILKRTAKENGWRKGSRKVQIRMVLVQLYRVLPPSASWGKPAVALKVVCSQDTNPQVIFYRL